MAEQKIGDEVDADPALPDLAQAGDVGMIELREEPGRAQEIVDLRRRALKARLHDLDRVEGGVIVALGEIDGPHRAAPDFTLEPVARNLRQHGPRDSLRMITDGHVMMRARADPLNMDAQDRVAGANLVAVLEIGRQDLLAVDEGAVVAPHVDEPAFGRVDFHHEMDAREVFVLGEKLEVRMLGAADQEGVVPIEGEFLPLVGTGDDRQDDAHGVARPAG